MKHCREKLIFCFIVVVSSLCRVPLVLSSIANEPDPTPKESANHGTNITTSFAGSKDPEVVAWKRNRRWRVKRAKRKTENRKSKEHDSTRKLQNHKGTKKSTKSCHAFIRSQQDRFLERLLLPVDHFKLQRQDPKLAYEMGFLANLAYWEFHKYDPLPKSCQGFRLEKDIGTSNIGDRFRHILHRAGVQISDALFHNSIAGISDFQFKRSQKWNRRHGATHNVSKEEHATNKKRRSYNLHYSFYNWHESGVAGVKFHDTDVLLSTSEDEKELVIAFAGTASAADAVTNIQTFEPANHSSFFMGRKNKNIQGSLHRGFLNAYSRVDRGSVLRLSNTTIAHPLLSDIQGTFGHCKSVPKPKLSKKEKKKKPLLDKQESSLVLNDSVNADGDINKSSSQETVPRFKRRKVKFGGGCRVKDVKLVDLLRKAVISALQSGRTVHVTGHSLGGGLATLLAGDIIINHPEVSVGRLHLWTFGAPQVADSLFLESAIQIAPRLKRFLKERGNGRFHRFVTLSDDCKVDAVAEVAKNALAVHKSNFHGRHARRLGGVHGHVLHFAEPHFLLTPDQFGLLSDDYQATTATHSTLAAHSLFNYLQGLSRESRDHPLVATMPLKLNQCFDD